MDKNKLELTVFVDAALYPIPDLELQSRIQRLAVQQKSQGWILSSIGECKTADGRGFYRIIEFKKG